MHKFNLIFFVIFFILFFNACEKSILEVESQPLYGIWVEQEWDDGVRVYRKELELDEDKHGFIFYECGEFLENGNSGGCGTPPISYTNYTGKWQYLSPDSIRIDVGFWAGTTHYIFKIVSLDKHKLRVKQSYLFE